MKNLLLILITGFFLFYAGSSFSAGTGSTQVGEQDNERIIFIERSGEMSDLVDVLVNEYRQQHTGQSFVFSDEPGGSNSQGIRIFSDDSFSRGTEGGLERITIAHEIVVPVMNVNNPYVGLLEEKGLGIEDFAVLLRKEPYLNTPGTGAGDVPVLVVVADNQHLITLLAGYAGISASEIGATRIPVKEDFLQAIATDKNIIGFCRLTDVLNAERNGFADNIQIIPVDKNRNGRIDRFEQIYSSPDELIRGAWVGKYPGKLSSKVYAAPVAGTYDEASAEFLMWVLNEGQEQLASVGYSSLLTREVTAGSNVINPLPVVDVPASLPVVPGFWLVVISLAALLFLIFMVVKAVNRKKTRLQSEDITLTPALNADSIYAPAGLYYDRTHTWAFMEQDGLVKVGVNDFLQHVTGNLTQVKMKSPGCKVRKGEKILTLIQEGKQLQVSSPVTGVIKANNQALVSNPFNVNADPYISGWVYQIEPSNWLRETKFMLMAGSFTEWLDEEFVRLKDFLAASANSDEVVYNHIVLQDGGELTDNVLATMEPKVWEDFQMQFLDVLR